MTYKNSIGFVYNSTLPDAIQLANTLMDSARRYYTCWISPVETLNANSEHIESASIIVTIGGDGTILRVARIASPNNIAILGINMGRIGFMTELSVPEAQDRLLSYLDGSPRIEKRMMLQATFKKQQEAQSTTMHALNDVVINRASTSKLLDINTQINDTHVATYRADGIIISTGTGSTSYALAAGGPVIYPESNMILVQPLAAHISFSKSLIISGSDVINLRVQDKLQSTISVDITSNILDVDSIVYISRSPHSTLFLRHGDNSAFYGNLASKLSGNKSEI